MKLVCCVSSFTGNHSTLRLLWGKKFKNQKQRAVAGIQMAGRDDLD
jgi:hypothetical protein